MDEVILRLEDIVKEFGEVVAVDHISIEVFRGEFFSVLGPSGCGKTTLLRLIAGLEKQDFGAIYLSGKLVNIVPPYQRNVNTVFQNYALFPHMDVCENVSFGLKMKGMRKGEREERVSKALELVGLAGMGSRRPGQLSGGQQQRVALARAVVNEPSVLLLDEPLGALDLKLRKQMQMELKSLQKRLGLTFIYVTHDQEEALTMSDRIAVMRSGKLEQVGSPSQIYEEPRTEFVANFIGISNLFSGELSGREHSGIIMTTSDGLEIIVPGDGTGFQAFGKSLSKKESGEFFPSQASGKSLSKKESEYRRFRLGNSILSFHSWAVYLFLYVPIIILAIFSFNKARINAVWVGFTLDWYKSLFNNASIFSALKNSLIVGIASTLISTVIGTLAAFAMNRFSFFGKRVFDSILQMPIIIPDIVMGISLLIFFVFIRFTLGLVSIIIAHVAFNISFVAIVVRARLHGYDKTLDEAAMDLGANPFQTFMKVTLPLILPGVIGGALIAFTLSFDDYLITSFVAGVGSTTLPMKVYSMIKFGVTPEINALSTLILLFTMILLLISQKLVPRIL